MTPTPPARARPSISTTGSAASTPRSRSSPCPRAPTPPTWPRATPSACARRSRRPSPTSASASSVSSPHADLRNPEGRARAAEASLALIAEHPDPLVRDQYLMQVSDRCRLSPEQLRSLPRPAPPARPPDGRRPACPAPLAPVLASRRRPRSRSRPDPGPVAAAPARAGGLAPGRPPARPGGGPSPPRPVQFGPGPGDVCRAGWGDDPPRRHRVGVARGGRPARPAGRRRQQGGCRRRPRAGWWSRRRPAPWRSCAGRPGAAPRARATPSWPSVRRCSSSACRRCARWSPGRTTRRVWRRRSGNCWICCLEALACRAGPLSERERGSVETVRAPFTASGEATPEFMALLMVGRERGFLTPHDLMSVLEGVELRTELISAVIGRVTAEGIEWREPKELLSDEGLDSLVAEVRPATAPTRVGPDGLARVPPVAQESRESLSAPAGGYRWPASSSRSVPPLRAARTRCGPT